MKSDDMTDVTMFSLTISAADDERFVPTSFADQIGASTTVRIARAAVDGVITAATVAGDGRTATLTLGIPTATAAEHGLIQLVSDGLLTLDGPARMDPFELPPLVFTRCEVLAASPPRGPFRLPD